MKNLPLLLWALGMLVFGVTSAYAQKNHFDNKPYIEGEMLVQVNAGKDIRTLSRKAPTEYELEIGEFLSPPMRIWLVTFDHTAVSHAAFQNWLYEQDEVSVADYNYLVEVRSTVPNDVTFTSQWHHNNTGQTGGTVDADIDSDLAWDITTGGLTATNDDIVVCMVEGGGGNLNHQDLSPNRWINTNEIDGNGIDDDGNGYIDDYYGWNTGTNNDNTGTGAHGTNCLGMIGAKGDNGLNVAGANWDVKLMVLNMGGSLSQSNVITAYTYPLVMRQMWNNSGGTQGAFVVATSASWGIDGANPASYPLWCAFYDTLGTYGILNVGATTNSNLDVDVAGDMPTACSSPYMIGVGRTDHNDNTAGGYGDQTIDFGAPGIAVVTTSGTTSTTTTTGTSFACPLTAGVIGLAYSIPCTNFMSIVMSDPQGAADLVLQALLDGTDPKSQLSTKFITGGRLNSRNTLDELMTATCSGTLCLSPSAVSTSSITDNSATINFTEYSSSDESVLYWHEVGTGTWNVVSGATPPYALPGLTSCTEYEYYLVSVCTGDTSSATSTQSFFTTGCGTCIEGGYCASTATNATDEWIDIFTIDSYTNNSGDDGGYGDYTLSSNIVLNKNQAYSFTMTPDWGGTLYNEYTRIWVDLDQNGTFDTGDLLYDQGTANQNTVNGSITIPGTALDGSTRMRVQMAYQGSGQTTLPNVCGSFTWGEVEDYCVEILSSCSMTVSANTLDATCFGNSDGFITVSNVSGATPPYTYLWSPGSATTSTVSNLSAGNYSVLISDSNGCDTTLNFTLNEPNAITIAQSVSNVSCNGGSDGSIDLTVAGGTPPYTYSWSNGATTQDISGLTAGTYDVTVTDANGCTGFVSVTISEPTALIGTLSITNGNCSVPGTATISASGGTGPYTYLWSTSETTASVGNLPAGAISVTITDANGCTGTESGTVVLTGAGTISLNTATDIPCNGDNTGSIDVTVTGGTAPFTYSWSNGATTEDLNGVGAGSYTLTLTDQAGCVSTFSHTLTEPATGISGSGTSTPVTLGNDGTIDLTVSGGTPPYTFSWNSGETTEDLSGLNAAGVYTCTVTDANGCVIAVDVTVNSSVGIFDQNLIDLVIYPNPSHGVINIVLPSSTYVDIAIHNNLGQQLLNTSNNGETSFSIDLNDFATGVYIVNVKTENGFEINRLVTVKR